MKRHIRVIFLLAFAVLVLGVLGLKAFQQGWFVTRPNLELNGQPALLYFTLSEGCDCQMRVIRRAVTQVVLWKPAEHLRVNIISIDFDERPDLAKHFHIDRPPALVLLDHNGEVFWMQDEPQSDDLPFDMAEVEEQIASLRVTEGR